MIAGMHGLSAGSLVTVTRDELLHQVQAAAATVRLASPFLSKPVSEEIATAVALTRASTHRLLTAATPRSVASGVLSARGLCVLLDAGYEIRSIPNLHAKLSLVDDSWGIVGSGNLTAAGLGGELIARANLELGVRLSARQIGVAIELFDGWWARAGEVTLDALAPYLDLEPIPPTPPTALKPIGKLIAPPPRPAPTPGIAQRQYWSRRCTGSARRLVNGGSSGHGSTTTTAVRLRR
jgi:phosphatidylserine/phosphatidylglycerophosphate/cardiolipin synthase-like enzyme